MTTPIQRPASNSEARKRLSDYTIVGHLDADTGKPATIYTPPECLVPVTVPMTPAGGHAPDVAPPSGVGSEREAATVPPAGLPGYFVAPDGFGAQVIWRGTGPDDPTCRPVLEGWRVQATAPDLWAAIVALVEGRAS